MAWHRLLRQGESGMLQYLSGVISKVTIKTKILSPVFTPANWNGFYCNYIIVVRLPCILLQKLPVYYERKQMLLDRMRAKMTNDNIFATEPILIGWGGFCMTQLTLFF